MAGVGRWLRQLFGGVSSKVPAETAPPDELADWAPALADLTPAAFDDAVFAQRLAAEPVARRLLLLRRARELLPDHLPILAALARLGGSEAPALWRQLSTSSAATRLLRAEACSVLAERAYEQGDKISAAKLAQQALALRPDDRAFLERALAWRDALPPLPSPARTTLTADSGLGLGVPVADRVPAGLTVGKRLGAGGFGTVYEAVDVVLERAVAIKFLHPHLVADPRRTRTFFDEARLLARLGHPGVVHVYDLDAERHVCVMELCAEGSLAERLKLSGCLTAPVAFSLLRRVTRTLADVHREGIAHGDLKPENLLFRAGLDLVIADFGVGAAGAGTPGYRAPEQARGEAPTPRADLFTLGCILAQMLTARPDPPLDALPGPEGALVRRLCAPKPADRPADADALLQEIASKSIKRRSH